MDQENAKANAGATVRKLSTARRSARRSLDSFPTCHLVEKDDLVLIEEALAQEHFTSEKSAVRPISVAWEEIRDGLRANFGSRTRSMAANPSHLSVDETEKRIKDLIAQINENRLVQFFSQTDLPLELAEHVGGKDYAFDIIKYFLYNQMPCQNFAFRFSEIQRAQMVDWIFWISCVARVPEESYFLAVHLLDKALLVDENISKMSDVENRVVMVAAVRLAGRFEFGPDYENAMCDRLKSVACEKLQCQEEKINEWESRLLEFFDFAISRQHLLHFLHIFWLLMSDVMSGTELENGWMAVKGLAYIAMAKASLMNNNPSLIAAAIMRIALHLFLNRGQLSESKFFQLNSSLIHAESQYVPIATNFLNWVLSKEITYIPTIARVFKANHHPSKQELETIAHHLKGFDNHLRRG